MLHFDSVSLRRGPRLLFEEASFQIHPGQKVGVTGANGTGKSSLFAMVLKTLTTDAGDISRPTTWIIAHLAQEIEATSQEAIEYVLDGDQGLRDLQRELMAAEASEDGEKIAHLHADLDHIGGYQANSRAGQLMHGLGFKAGDEHRPIKDFSGGWRMRLNLARTLMCRSDLLLLDEPTNHLDLDTVIWLENWLKQYPGTLLLISHDRDFLDSVCSNILHIEHQHATLYSGNYTAFERIRTEHLANQQASHEKQQREVGHMKDFVRRFKAKASKAKQAQSRVKALERMQLIAPAHVDSPFHFTFKSPDKNPNPLLKLEKCAAGYGDTTIINQVELTLNPGDRIGLLGPNGAGKSTLIKLLAGELLPQGGECTKAKDLKIGYFAQHQLEQLHAEHSPLDHLQQLDKKVSEQSARDFLGGFGFLGDKALEKVAPFSGGEKSRLVLALTVYQKPNLLLLDEPTNHLDLEMRQALATALQDFEGAMVIVSHDRHLLRMSCDQLELVHSGILESFNDDLDAYPAWLVQQAKSQDSTSSSNNSNESTESRKQRKRDAADARKQLQPLKKSVSRAERKLDHLQANQLELEAQLADNSIYEIGNKDKLSMLLQNKATIDSELEIIELEWLDAVGELELAEKTARID